MPQIDYSFLSSHFKLEHAVALPDKITKTVIYARTKQNINKTHRIKFEIDNTLPKKYRKVNKSRKTSHFALALPPTPLQNVSTSTAHGGEIKQ